ncbi:MAG: M28 family peptidase [bacterium]
MLDAQEVLSELNFERLAGSPGEKKALELIGGYLKKLHLEYQLEPFQLNSFDTGNAQIKLGEKVYPAHPFGLTQATNVQGDLIFLENAKVIFHNRSAYRGKIIISKNYSRKYQQYLLAGEVKAFILIGKPFREAHSISVRQKKFAEGFVPAVVVDYDVGAELSKFSGQSVTLHINQHAEKRTAHNLVVNISGKKTDENLIISCAHYDTVARSPGITDNGGGVVALLKIAEYFSNHPPSRDLRLVWFSGEELGLLGSYDYVQKHLAEIKNRLMMVLNIDVAGDDLGVNEMVVMGTRELLGYVSGIAREKGVYFNAGLNIYSSDGVPFSVYEIPSVNLGRYGGKTSFRIHTSGDNPEYISSRGLEPIISSAVNILNRCLNAEVFPFVPEIDAELKEKLEKYLWQSTFNPPHLHWTPHYMK